MIKHRTTNELQYFSVEQLYDRAEDIVKAVKFSTSAKERSALLDYSIDVHQEFLSRCEVHATLEHTPNTKS